MKKIFVIIIIAMLTLSTNARSEEKDSKMPRRIHGEKKLLVSLNLTDAQKKDMAALRLESEKRGIDLRAKAETARIELRSLLMAETPDQSAIEKKVTELIKHESNIRMAKIDGWFAANKMMTPEQQKIWIRALRAGAQQANGAGRNGMHRPMRRAECQRQARP